MIIDTNKIMSVTEVNQNFSKAARLVEKSGKLVIFKNNKPRYMLLDLQNEPVLELTDEEKIDVVARRILNKYRKAFEELAK